MYSINISTYDPHITKRKPNRVELNHYIVIIFKHVGDKLNKRRCKRQGKNKAPAQNETAVVYNNNVRTYHNIWIRDVRRHRVVILPGRPHDRVYVQDAFGRFQVPEQFVPHTGFATHFLLALFVVIHVRELPDHLVLVIVELDVHRRTVERLSGHRTGEVG